jgi:hypothetical protein
VRMFEGGENVAFLGKAGTGFRMVGGEVENFDGDQFLEGSVVAGRFEDRALTASSDTAAYAVGTEAIDRFGGREETSFGAYRLESGG